MRNNPIGVFDSGVGGLNVLEKCEQLMPNEKFIYLADEAHMPYGTKPPGEIKRFALGCAQRLIEMNCKALLWRVIRLQCMQYRLYVKCTRRAL